MDYSKLSDSDLLALKNKDYSALSNEGLLLLKNGRTETPKTWTIDYSDILNNNNLSKEQKAELIKERGEAERKAIDKEKNREINKMRAGAALEIGSAFIPVGGGLKLATTLAKAGKPVAARLAGEVLKNTPSLATSGAIGGLGNAIVTQKDNIQDYLKEIGLGAAGGITFGKGLQALGKGGKALINSEPFIKTIPKVQQILNSVPAEYSERALRKELSGNSILKGKFNTKDLNENYKEAGEKAIKGFQEAKLAANQELNNATRNLNELPKINREQLLNNIVENVDKYSYGGDANAALDQKAADIYDYMNKIAKEKANTSLHVTKRNIQNLLRGKYGAETGEGINALKDIARNINEELYKISPDYEKANIVEQNLHDINDLMGGMNRKTIASKLRNIETDANIRSGYNQAAEELNSLVNPEYKFMEDVKDLRAREALEQLYPGQFGPSGSPEGFGNLTKSAIINALLGGGTALVTHNPLAGAAAASLFSPKISGKLAIKGIGNTNKVLSGLRNVYDKALEPYLNSERVLLNEFLKPKSSKVIAQENNEAN